MVSSRKPENVAKAVQQLQEVASAHKCEVFGVTCNAGCENDQEKLVSEATKKFGKIDILVSCAGTNPVCGKLLEVSANLNGGHFLESSVLNSFVFIR